MVPRFTDATVAAVVRRSRGIMLPAPVATYAAAGCAAADGAPATWRGNDMPATLTPKNELMFTMMLTPSFRVCWDAPTGRI